MAADRGKRQAPRKGGIRKPGSAKSAGSGPSVGRRLREAREKKGLSLKDVARELHLDHWMLEALERDDFAALGAPVFAKGHLRKYASLLELPGDEIMIAYYQSANTGETPPLIADTLVRAQRERRGGRFAALIVVVLLAIAALVATWWVLGRGATRATPANGAEATQRNTPPARPATATQPVALRPSSSISVGDALREDGASVGSDADPGTAPATPAPIAEARPDTRTDAAPTRAVPNERPSAPAAGIDQTGDTGEVGARGATEVDDRQAGDSSGDRAAGPAASADDAQVAANRPVVADGQVRVELYFDDESWVEINDGNGDRMLYGMGNPGTTRSLSGPPPIQVFLGRVHGVRMRVDGDDFPIPQEARRGNTARFVIDPR